MRMGASGGCTWEGKSVYIYIEEGKLGLVPNMKITKPYAQLAAKFLVVLSIKFSLLFSQN